MLKVFSTMATLALIVNSYGLDLYKVNDGNLKMPPLVDNSTYANVDEIHTTHLHIDLKADFNERTLSGFVLHTMKAVKPTLYAQFDIWDLNITSVYDGIQGFDLKFWIVDPNPAIGQVLHVELPWEMSAGEIFDIGIRYSTSPTGGAFSWLTAEQTACGNLPYVLTDCEDINARTVYPL